MNKPKIGISSWAGNIRYHRRGIEDWLSFRTTTNCANMAPHDIRRPHKRPAISDQQKRRELSLQRQQQNRRDAQQQARSLASTLLSLSSSFDEPSTSEPVLEIELNELESGTECSLEILSEREFNEPALKELDVRQASKLKSSEARKWFSKQLLLPEWMIDVPDRLSDEWLYFFFRLFVTSYLRLCFLQLNFYDLFLSPSCVFAFKFKYLRLFRSHLHSVLGQFNVSS